MFHLKYHFLKKHKVKTAHIKETEQDCRQRTHPVSPPPEEQCGTASAGQPPPLSRLQAFSCPTSWTNRRESVFQITGSDRLMMRNTLDCGLHLLTLVSVVSAFMGILFSRKSSDSRTSNTVLADTKGGMFNLKKKKKKPNKRLSVLSNKKLLYCGSE